ncbi:HAD family hydrolase [Nonomuraea sp. NPDC048826]|uniref:HAD family hydrolase n=1 Tax=Nonomuraea sp. NPDC048826 TaxID=3364347 RepID=UPI00371D9C54
MGATVDCAEAFRPATGQVMRQLADMTGRTERAIAADTLRLHHIEASDELLHTFGLALAESFLTFEAEIRRRGGVLDGAAEALARLAQERATANYGHPFAAENTVLIEDTPNDVLAGHLGGARVVAVATGSCSAEMLREAGAELVLTDLGDTRAVVRAILDDVR